MVAKIWRESKEVKEEKQKVVNAVKNKMKLKLVKVTSFIPFVSSQEPPAI